MTKVSVIIPAYNAMRYLPQTMDSLLNQSFTDFEAIIINDGSTDNLEEWFDSLSDQRVRLITQVNQGQAKARNVGLECAQGEYIAFLDADDLWEPSKLEKQVARLEANPEIGVVYTWVVGIDANGILRGRTIRNSTEGRVWRELSQHNILECGSTPLIRRFCFEQVGGFDEQLPPCEDLDLWLRLACHYSFAVVKEPLVYYRQHPTSSGKNWRRAEKGYIALLEKAFQNPPSDVSPAEIDSLKSKAYAKAYIGFLAWGALQSKSRDYQSADDYCRKAQQYYPRIIFSKGYVKLVIAIWLIQYLKPQNHDRFFAFLYFLRRHISRVFKPGRAKSALSKDFKE